MRDVQDFHKYVDMLSKSVNRRPKDLPERKDAPREDVPVAEQESAAQRLTPKTGRGPRLSETREQLLRRLLDPTLTLDETARILEVCPTTVRRYTNRGQLACVRSAGNQRRFQLSDVLSFKEAQGAFPPDAED